MKGHCSLLPHLQYKQSNLQSRHVCVVELKPVLPTMFLRIHHNDVEEDQLLLLYLPLLLLLLYQFSGNLPDGIYWHGND
jgi:hypothetical protein